MYPKKLADDGLGCAAGTVDAGLATYPDAILPIYSTDADMDKRPLFNHNGIDNFLKVEGSVSRLRLGIRVDSDWIPVNE